MQEKDEVIVASVLIMGMTEKDLLDISSSLYSMAKIFFPYGDSFEYRIDTITLNNSPLMVLLVSESYWEAFARDHDAIDFSVVTAQPAIWEEVH